MSSLLMEASHAPIAREPSGPPSATLNVDICGVPTKLLASAYSNRIFVVVTQQDNLGTLIQAFREDPIDSAGPGCYGTRILLGRRDDEALEVRARILPSLFPNVAKRHSCCAA
jgi:proteasome assembly chaperone 3